MKGVYIFILVLFILGCKDDINYEKPEGLLSKSQMIDVLCEMHIAVGTSNLPNLNLEKNRNYMSLVYKKYGIDSTRFAESNLYYTSHIQEYEEIFEEVERRLKTLRDFHQNKMDSILEIKTGTPETRRIRDSIKQARNLKDID
jgi:hypothetical protein